MVKKINAREYAYGSLSSFGNITVPRMLVEQFQSLEMASLVFYLSGCVAHTKYERHDFRKFIIFPEIIEEELRIPQDRIEEMLYDLCVDGILKVVGHDEEGRSFFKFYYSAFLEGVTDDTE